MTDRNIPDVVDSTDGVGDPDKDLQSPAANASQAADRENQRAEKLLLTESQLETTLSAQETELERESDGAEQPICINHLIDEHSKFLFGYGYRLAGSVADAEDLTQQTFMIAHQKLNQLRCSKSVKSWLCAILRSCWLKSIRRNKPTPVCNFEFELDELLEDEIDESNIDSHAIQNAISELPDDYRLVLLMFYFEELSYQQIAEKLNVKMGTVMSRLSRAKDRVKRKLAGKENLQ